MTALLVRLLDPRIAAIGLLAAAIGLPLGNHLWTTPKEGER